MPIRRLDPVLVDRIAAGEVIERPAAAVKELVENALDAGARRIDIVLEAGGRRLIRVADDGCGMTAEDLALSVERHATSKLPGDDLFAISTFGFRGEALPSIAAVSRLEMLSRDEHAEMAHALVVEAGTALEVRPAARPHGTTVEVKDLFSAVPARLKFLKGDRAETGFVADTVKRLAMAYCDVRFTLAGEGTATLDYGRLGEGADALARRVGEVLGREFRDNSVALGLEREGLAIHGFAGLPAYTRASASAIHLFVNGRPVRDKLIAGAVRGAYADLLPAGRHPAIALYLDVDPRAVDVNVHPAKAEVRFREAGLVRALIVSAIGEALRKAGIRPVTQASDRAIAAFAERGARSDACVTGRIPALRRWQRRRRAPPAGRGRASRARARPPSNMRPGRRGPSTRRPFVQETGRPAITRSIPWERRALSCTRPISWRRRPTAWSSWISMPPTNGSSMSG